MLSDPNHKPLDDSARRPSLHDMDFRYAASPISTSPFAQAYHTRIARMEDGRPIDSWEREYETTTVDTLLSRSPSSGRRRSTIPIPDLSTLAFGVPEMVIANTANDPLVSSPPSRRWSGSARKSGNTHRKAAQDDGGKVVEMGLPMVAEGVTLIEDITVDQEREHELVPGIDTKRPSIGVTRPSDEDKRRFVEGWAEEGLNGTNGRGTDSQTPSTRKSVNFTHITTQSPRYYNPRKEFDFSTTSSGSGSGTSSSDYPLIYSPDDSPPLDARTYEGTILDLSNDPQEIREYRDLERRKEVDRRESGNSAGSGGGSSESRSGSINLGRSGSVNFGTRPMDQGRWDARKGSLQEQASDSRHSYFQRGRHHHHARSPGTRRMPLGEHSGADPTDLVTASSRSPKKKKNTILQDVNTCLSPTQVNSHASPYISPTSPITSRQHLFHPDLHPVADHHVPGSSRQERPDMLGSLNLASQSDDAVIIHTTDPVDFAEHKEPQSQAMQQALTSLTDSSSADETSPSSSGTIRPPLGPGGGPKARTVADFGATTQDEWGE